MTDFSTYRFTVKEDNEGGPWIAFEPSGTQLAVLAGGFLGFKLNAGTTIADAQEIARILNAKISSVSYTTP